MFSATLTDAFFLQEERHVVSVTVELPALCTGRLRVVEAQHLGAALASKVERVVLGSGIIDVASLESMTEG